MFIGFRKYYYTSQLDTRCLKFETSAVAWSQTENWFAKTIGNR